MLVLDSIATLKAHLDQQRDLGHTIGLVPTMGALHAGHLSLVQACREQGHHIVVSIFVNPKQFNNAEDLGRYPRQLSADLDLLRPEGVHVVFAPSEEEIYANSQQVQVDLGELDKVMEGLHRPGHFDGVIQVVHRLFEVVAPHVAYFGEKDRQQLLVIQQMVRELRSPVQICPCQTVRSANGLALSSRNTLLTAKQQEKARILYNSLCLAMDMANTRSMEDVLDIVQQRFNADPEVDLDYFEFYNTSPFQRLNKWADSETVVAFVAATIGGVRLIDNMLVKE